MTRTSMHKLLSSHKTSRTTSDWVLIPLQSALFPHTA